MQVKELATKVQRKREVVSKLSAGEAEAATLVRRYEERVSGLQQEIQSLQRAIALGDRQDQEEFGDYRHDPASMAPQLQQQWGRRQRQRQRQEQLLAADLDELRALSDQVSDHVATLAALAALAALVTLAQNLSHHSQPKHCRSNHGRDSNLIFTPRHLLPVFPTWRSQEGEQRRISSLKARTDQRITDMEIEIGKMVGQQSALEQELQLGEVQSRDRRRRVTVQVRDLDEVVAQAAMEISQLESKLDVARSARDAAGAALNQSRAGGDRRGRGLAARSPRQKTVGDVENEVGLVALSRFRPPQTSCSILSPYHPITLSPYRPADPPNHVSPPAHLPISPTRW